MKELASADRPSTGVTPLLVRGAVQRTGDTRIPGNYSASRHVWLLDGEPIVSSTSSLPELATKTGALPERDDISPRFLLEMQTKTRAELERDDQVSPFALQQRLIVVAAR